MDNYNKYHYVEELDEPVLWKWAVKWNNKVVCVCSCKEWAKSIIEALDGWKPYVQQETN